MENVEAISAAIADAAAASSVSSGREGLLEGKVGAGVDLAVAPSSVVLRVSSAAVSGCSSSLSGPPAELLEMFGISANNIVKAVNDVIKL